jgi:hypothetical protein
MDVVGPGAPEPPIFRFPAEKKTRDSEEVGAGVVLAKERILECLVPLTRYIQNLSKFRLAVQIV